ncbi:MAG: hypothetical protein WBV74_02815 [Pseudonocardiaceae bacterium]
MDKIASRAQGVRRSVSQLGGQAGDCRSQLLIIDHPIGQTHRFGLGC